VGARRAKQSAIKRNVLVEEEIASRRTLAMTLEFACKRLGRNKAIVAIARKLLVAVWYILAQHKTDRFAEPEAIARKFLKFAYQLGKENRPQGQPAAQFVRQRLDALSIGNDLTRIAWGSKKPIPLLPSANKVSDVPNGALAP
jgi:hypothetical protein